MTENKTRDDQQTKIDGRLRALQALIPIGAYTPKVSMYDNGGVPSIAIDGAPMGRDDVAAHDLAIAKPFADKINAWTAAMIIGAWIEAIEAHGIQIALPDRVTKRPRISVKQRREKNHGTQASWDIAMAATVAPMIPAIVKTLRQAATAAKGTPAQSSLDRLADLAPDAPTV